MIPAQFPEANAVFGPPPDLTGEQCSSIVGFIGEIYSGSCEGARVVVTAFHPTAEDLARINAGEPIFLSCLGGLPPHFLTTSFRQAVNPS